MCFVVMLNAELTEYTATAVAYVHILCKTCNIGLVWL